MYSNFSKVKIYQEEITDLVTSHENENYLRVLLLSPQLLVLILDKIAEKAEELFGSIWNKDISDEDKEVYRLVGKLEREQNDKTKIAQGLVSYYESEHWGKQHSKKQFVKYFTKLEDLISLRNEFAHEFYESKAANKRIKSYSKGAIELLYLFANHEYFSAA